MPLVRSAAVFGSLKMIFISGRASFMTRPAPWKVPPVPYPVTLEPETSILCPFYVDFISYYIIFHRPRAQ